MHLLNHSLFLFHFLLFFSLLYKGKLRNLIIIIILYQKLQNAPDQDVFNPRPSDRLLSQAGDHSINVGEGGSSRGVNGRPGVPDVHVDLDVMAVPIGESYSLLDWGDEPLASVIDNGITNGNGIMASSLTTSTSTSTSTPLPQNQPQSLLSLFVLKPAAEQLSSMDSRKFQDLWGKMIDVFSGTWDNNLLPNSLKYTENRISVITISEIEAAMYKLRIMVMASGPAPADSVSQNNGFKFFLYGIEEDNLLLGTDGATFLAQLIFFPSSKEHSATVSATIKSNSSSSKNSGSRNDFGDLILEALSLAYTSSSPLL
jgi:hypothetical protein